MKLSSPLGYKKVTFQLRKMKSVSMMRYRLRQRLNLGENETLESYIKSLVRRREESV